jgi:hypothetical protein
MSYSNLNVKQSYLGNGVTLVFAIPFQIVKDLTGLEEVEVVLRDFTNPLAVTYLTLTPVTHYNLTGGTITTPVTDVTMLVAPTANQNLIVRRKFPLTQVVDFDALGAYTNFGSELSVDRLVAMVQLAFEYLTRVPQLTKGTQKPQPNMPEPVASTLWGWDVDAQTVRYWTFLEVLEDLVGTVLLRANNLSDLQSVPTALDNLGIDPFKSTVSQTLLNNVGLTNITNLLVQGAAYTSAKIWYEIRRTTSTNDKSAVGELTLWRNPRTGNWNLEVGPYAGENDIVVPAGVTFNLQQVGADAQVRYSSDNLAGASYVGTIKTTVKYFEV